MCPLYLLIILLYYFFLYLSTNFNFYHHLSTFIIIFPYVVKKPIRTLTSQSASFYYASSLLHSIPDPSRNITLSVPCSNTLIWPSFFNINSMSISFSGFASLVYSTNFSARYPARKSSPCICCFYCFRKLSQFSTCAFQAIKYTFIAFLPPHGGIVSLNTLHPIPFTALLRHPFLEKTLLHVLQTILEANEFVSGIRK